MPSTNTDTVEPVATAENTIQAERAPIRWGGIVWGGLIIAVAGWILWTVSSTERLRVLFRWVSGFTLTTLVAVGLIGCGLLIVLCALLAGISVTRHRKKTLS